MAGQPLLTYYTYEGVPHPMYIIINDEMADDMRQYTGTHMVEFNTDYTSVTEFFNRVSSYVGEVFSLGLPAPDLPTDAMNELLGYLPNCYPVPVSSTPFETQVGDTTLYGWSIYRTERRINFADASNNQYLTPFSCGVSAGESNGRLDGLGFYFLVLKSSEVAGGKFNIPSDISGCVTARFNYITGTRAYRFDYMDNIGDADRRRYMTMFNGQDIPVPPAPVLDPYEAGGGASGTGGGTGTFSETGDVVGIPGLPTLSAVDTGFITLFNPTAAQVKQLAAYMWSNSFDIATFKNIVANPIDCILGLTIVPVNPPDAGTKAVSVGNIATDVSMPYLSSQYVEVDCGTLNVQEFWGSYLDYSPYTKMSLYLPYIGIVPLDIDDVMNATITIKYHVDVLSGACVAYVLCNGTQLYTYIGQCSSNVPITSNDFTNTVNGILGIAGSIGSLVATGGASAPTEIGKIAGNAINALKPNIQKSGAMSGTGGLMGVQTPYLICQRPRQSVPSSQNTFTGYPSNITALLSDLSGYTEVDKIHLEGVPCTNEEMDEIMTLLESGVYI